MENTITLKCTDIIQEIRLNVSYVISGSIFLVKSYIVHCVDIDKILRFSLRFVLPELLFKHI